MAHPYLPGHAFNEVAIDGSANSKREKVTLTKIVTDVVEDALFAVDVSIGYDNNVA